MEINVYLTRVIISEFFSLLKSNNILFIKFRYLPFYNLNAYLSEKKRKEKNGTISIGLWPINLLGFPWKLSVKKKKKMFIMKTNRDSIRKLIKYYSEG